ncbi:MAG: uL15 family ribosomal protein, partial [Clostridia bacterium]|nr:uL15 family ribosomal protein [Clostridia bacterium]
DVVTIDALKQKGLVPKKEDAIKVLARGTLDKVLTVEADAFSLDAVKMIVLVGGTAIKK